VLIIKLIVHILALQNNVPDFLTYNKYPVVIITVCINNTPWVHKLPPSEGSN